MIITIKLNIAKDIYKTNPTLFHGVDYRTGLQLQKGPDVMDSIEVFKIDIEKHTQQEIQKLRVKLSGLVPKPIIDKIDRYLEAIENPDTVLIKDIDTFKKSLDEYIKSLKIRWLWKIGSDQVMLPYAIKKLAIIPAQRRTPRHILLTTIRGTIESGKDVSTSESSYAFFSHDMYERNKEDDDDIDTTSYFEFNDDDLSMNGDDDDDDKPKKSTKKSPKRVGLNLRTILFKKGIFYNSEELQAQYVLDYESWKDIQLTKVGHQFTCDALGFANQKGEYSSYFSERVTGFIEDKHHQKLVVDEYMPKDTSNGMSIVTETSFGISYLPYHFYVRLYNITKHSYCRIHVSVLDKYTYNKKLLDNLIVHPNVKTLVNSLIDGELEIEGKDIIEGKSGGLTILGFGPPGNGKTLTGEIYSEYVEKPLYQIQSSQLGISVKDIEENLHAVLRRAERWNCILMIDEADTYIYKRGQDILQNCIVGTFLRLLEYYNGILFLTTNRADIIDEAIMSRVTVSIEYKNPGLDDLFAIWETHIPAYGLNISGHNLLEIAKKFPMSGRDVRNCLKLLSRYYKDGEPITVEKIEAIKDYLPSITV